MNIFYLDENPTRASAALCDKHLPKCILEYARLICAAHIRFGALEETPTGYIKHPIPYSLSDDLKNHPCLEWVCHSRKNYLWLAQAFIGAALEYRFRNGKQHLSYVKCKHLAFIIPPGLADRPFTQPPLCMPNRFKQKNHVTAYREYYAGTKAHLAKWKHCAPPSWWPFKQQELF